MKPIEKEGLEALGYEIPSYDDVEFKVTNGVFHSRHTVYGIIVGDCYYPYYRTQSVDVEFASANNLHLIKECPDYLDEVMKKFAIQHSLH